MASDRSSSTLGGLRTCPRASDCDERWLVIVADGPGGLGCLADVDREQDHGQRTAAICKSTLAIPTDAVCSAHTKSFTNIWDVALVLFGLSLFVLA